MRPCKSSLLGVHVFACTTIISFRFAIFNNGIIQFIFQKQMLLSKIVKCKLLNVNCFALAKPGAGGGSRTHDPLFTKQLL